MNKIIVNFLSIFVVMVDLRQKGLNWRLLLRIIYTGQKRKTTNRANNFLEALRWQEN